MLHIQLGGVLIFKTQTQISPEEKQAVSFYKFLHDGKLHFSLLTLDPHTCTLLDSSWCDEILPHHCLSDSSFNPQPKSMLARLKTVGRVFFWHFCFCLPPHDLFTLPASYLNGKDNLQPRGKSDCKFSAGSFLKELLFKFSFFNGGLFFFF